MNRRSYLGACVLGAAGLAGCSGFLGDDSDDAESSDRGPAETVEAFYEAALNGDADAVRSYVHPNAEIPPPSDEAIEQLQESSLQLEGTTVVEERDDEATVEVTVSQETMGGEREERTVEYLLRRADGEWLIYDLPLSGSEGPAAPQVQWDMRERAEGGAVTAVVFEHNGGDTVDSTALSATVAGSTVDSPDASSDVEVATVVVVPFDGDGETVSTGTTVELVWTDPDGDSTQTLASFTLTSETAGSPAGQLRIES